MPTRTTAALLEEREVLVVVVVDLPSWRWPADRPTPAPISFQQSPTGAADHPMFGMSALLLLPPLLDAAALATR